MDMRLDHPEVLSDFETAPLRRVRGWAGFALVWVALVLITVDSWRARSSAAVTPPGRVTEPV